MNVTTGIVEEECNMGGILQDVMEGKQISRAPVVAKIWVDLAAKLMDRDWLSLFQNQALAASTVVEAAVKAKQDGARCFLFARRDIRKDEQGYFQWKGGNRFGRIDEQGGGATLLENVEDFDWKDPEMIINYQVFKSKTPLIESVDDVKQMRIPTLEDYERLYAKTVEQCKLVADGKLDLIGDCNSGSLAFCVAMHGMSETLMDMYDEPELLHAMMEKGIELSIMQARFFLSKGIRILRYNDSVANMMVISPDCWREFVGPYITKFCREVHRMCPEARIYCHICGDVAPILQALVDTGLDCIAPLDPMGGKTIGELRKMVGDNYMLMGGVNTFSFVEKTPQEIKEETKRCILEGFRHGHYAAGSGCSMPRAATLEGMLAMAEASYELEE